MASRISCKRYSQDLISDWNTVIENSDDVWIFHDKKICDVYANRKGAEDISIIIYFNDIPSGILPLYSSKGRIECFDQSGPAFIRSLSNRQRTEALRFINEKLEHYKNKATSIRISSANLAVNNLAEKHAVNPLLELRALVDKATPYYYMDLSLSEEQLYKNLEVRCRNAINKFKREELSKFVIRKATLQDLDTVWSLYQNTMDRTHLPFHPKKELEFYLNYEYCSFFIAYYKKDNSLEPACAINIGIYKNTGLYWLSYSNSDYLNTGIATYLLWYAILYARRGGVEHFDIGNQDFAPIGSKADRISTFKKGFGGSLRYKYSMEWESPMKVLKKDFKLLIKNFLKKIKKG